MSPSVQELPTACKLPFHVIARALRARGNLVQELPTSHIPDLRDRYFASRTNTKVV